jgi:hypothetical protein
MGGRGEALEEARAREEQGPRADGHEGAFFAGVGGLQRGEGLDQFDGFGGVGGGFVFQGRVDAAAAGDDQDVVVVEVFVGVFVVDVRFDG